MKMPKELTKVTPVSRALTFLLLLTLPVIGFVWGMKYQEFVSYVEKPSLAVFASDADKPSTCILDRDCQNGQVCEHVTACAPGVVCTGLCK